MTTPETPVTPVNPVIPGQPAKKKSVKLPVVFLILSAIIIFASFNISDLNANERERYNQAKNSGNQATGTVVEVREEKERAGGKRPRTTLVYCPVYEFAVSQDRTTTFTDRINCEESKEAITVGATAPVIFSNGGFPAFADTQGTTDQLAAKQNGGIFLLIAGIVVFALSALVLIIRLVGRKTVKQ